MPTGPLASTLAPGPPAAVSSPPAPAGAPPLLLDARAAAALLGIGRSTWLRLVSAGKAPVPLKLGACVRWPRPALEAWIARACPPRETLRR